MIVAHNLTAMNANRMLGINSRSTAKSTEKLSSGYKINRAADDAAGLAMSEKMRRQIRGLNQGANNTTDGISFVKIGDGAMNEVSDMINRMTELSVKAANGTMSESDREAVDSEMKQLKKEIDRVSATTVFNEIPIFDNTNYQASLTFSGIPGGGLELYNASYDDATGEVTFGGVVMLGQRVSWDEISPDMVYVDGDGKQAFRPGTYTYSKEGMELNVIWEEGAKAPKLTMELSVVADSDGIALAGQKFGWEDLVDENGNAAGKDNVHSGSWALNGGNFKAAINIPYETSTLQEFIDAINTCTSEKITYIVEQDYVNNEEEKAVKVNLESGMRISNELKDALAKSPDFSVSVEADETGIWLKDIPGSKKTWAQMGIDWKNGINSSNGGLYHYEYCTPSAPNVPYLSFDFNISEIASMDSVIVGLNGMTLTADNITNSYKAAITADKSAQTGCPDIIKLTPAPKDIEISFEQEVALGRDFNRQTVTGVGGVETVDVDTATNTAVVKFDATDGTNNSVTYSGAISAAEAGMASEVMAYLDYVTVWATQAALQGKPLDQATPATLKEIVGSGNISQTGRFDKTVTITSDMVVTTASGAHMNVGTEHVAAFIDFSQISDLNELLFKGFDSNCPNCVTNHYSVVFKGDLSLEGKYVYSKVEDKDKFVLSTESADSTNYTLEININYLKNLMDGKVDGQKKTIAEALVNIFNADKDPLKTIPKNKESWGNRGHIFDFHLTQYAADGDVLYICNYAENAARGSYDSFDTKPYTSVEQSTCVVNLASTQNGSMELKYDYSFKGAANYIEVKMVPSAGGEYVANGDGTYSKFDPNNDQGKQRYDAEVVYKDPQNNTLADKKAAAESWAKNTLADMLSHTKVSLDATDYTYVQLSGKENENIAIRAVYDKKIGRTDYVEMPIRIQHSAEVDDYTEIPRFALSTMALGLSEAGAKTMEQALLTLDYVAEASNYVSSRRAQYGALQNRLEHTYNNLQNTAENTQAAESRIRDTDMASEMVWYANNNILQQAGQAMLAQANQSNQGVLTLLSQ